MEEDIPRKAFYSIGEVSRITGVHTHVLRYWESEFPMLAPQKNRAGQRVYRKRDVEMALRIKELLYEDQYTIAGAKKRLANDLRGGGKLKVVGAEDESADSALNLADPDGFAASANFVRSPVVARTVEERQGLKQLASELRELLSLLEKETQNKTQ